MKSLILRGKNHVDGYEYDPDDPEDDVNTDEAFFDKEGRFDLTKVLPNNSDDNRIEYIYWRDRCGCGSCSNVLISINRTDEVQLVSVVGIRL